MKLYVFDVRKMVYEEIEVKEIMERKFQEQIEEFEKKIGLKFEIKGINNAEELVQAYYYNKGYSVVHSRRLAQSYQKASKLLQTFQPDISQIEKDLHSPGVPDFLVFNDEEVFFVEAKSWADGLRATQLIWLFQTKYPVKIFVQDAR